jgi:hypothetical protein
MSDSVQIPDVRATIISLPRIMSMSTISMVTRKCKGRRRLK